ncbi:hypothetical protein BBO99_00000825 [Phytophthora kernoviae]|uniref:Exocyst complex component Sec8 n=2 Tax=Phytophthora kernoviae TaxID=325452 RepID=A0A3R7IP83_9STRA|nr:hypothetical protein G195_001582 [Phytophthora kernoviae 00238/432]KAG2531849.1 hypothetical protein JM16_000650 [Phytophthora kernoviae]KAG2532731.1 hypothetical protein JM18_000732 [Phytophthora kernoviae]RLN44404.1 hypothetical protein BBI17_000995 [Phytophthora kernoviae]RLN85025.1 hypothetical protein BBO99_00000825 [Phytophthora kernoviae]
MSVIDSTFFDKKFSVQRYMLRYVVGAATDELREQQLQKVRKFRAMADDQIDGVIDQSFVNFNTSLARFTAISNQLQVDQFASALDLVFSEQLVAFHATTGLRTDLMEYKQTIEDRLHREREAIGTIKSSIEHELDEVVEELSRLCRGIFNSSSTTSFANAFTEATFGTHDHSSDFGTFLRLLFSVLRRVTQRHYLVAVYFEADGDNWDYGMFEVVTRISGVLERVLGEYLEGASSSQPVVHDPALASNSDSGELFKLSRNKPPTHKLLDGNNKNDPAAATHSRLVCESSVFHLPEVYEDLERIGKDLQQLFRANTNQSGTNSSAPALSGFTSFLSTFITQKWIPKVKSKAQHFMAIKARGLTTMCRLPIPSDTSYQPPSIDSLLHVVENLRVMMTKMPTHASDLSSVLEAAVLNWLEECAAIVRDIREQTLNHQQLQNKGVTYADLGAIFHEYEGYQRAKLGSPIPFHHSKVQPMNNGITSTRVCVEEAIAAKELDLESDLYDPDAWMQGPQGLLMDNARIGMLGYANSASVSGE